mmetsp:Transcript_12294/g.13442  ORF Transcript_12294/g.13442 Transcript_12294/m.13442 type:complete len:193 (-) Transcript_12294:107-685(-)
MERKTDSILIKSDRNKLGEVLKKEVRVTAKGSVKSYLKLSLSKLVTLRLDEVILRGMGHTLGKTVTVCEILKRRIENMDQNTRLYTKEVIDEVQDPKTGIIKEVKRYLSCIEIVLKVEGTLPESAEKWFKSLVEEVPKDSTQENSTSERQNKINLKPKTHINGVKADFGKQKKSLRSLFRQNQAISSVSQQT